MARSPCHHVEVRRRWNPLPTDHVGEPRRLSESLERVVGGLGAPRVDLFRRLFEQWEDLVGATVAAHAAPLRIERSRLIVAVDDPAWATQLQWLGPQVLERLRQDGTGAELESIDVVVRPRRR